ncbi:MAG TPA: YdeI/OmpD-associated family protein [Dermatophilaceae bacterium]|nr:YdeI/OmpD-associated family protein [Dermatophilaceae bacterium]
MAGRPGGTAERPALFFTGPEEFRAWLEEHHAGATELWMGLRKKHVPDRGLTWEDAVPEALCFGWIDSVVQRLDDDAVRQRWTPRKASSTWSAVNVGLVERLAAEGRMRPAGLAAYARRRPERTAIYAFERDDLALTAEQEAALRADPAASAFWDQTTASYRRGVAAWLQDAKREDTRARRLAQLVADARAGRLIPPQRYGTEPAWVARAAAAARGADADSARGAGADTATGADDSGRGRGAATHDAEGRGGSGRP